jgi:hypothetical protein
LSHRFLCRAGFNNEDQPTENSKNEFLTRLVSALKDGEEGSAKKNISSLQQYVKGLA